MRALARGIARRCPRCGQGGLFRRWFDLAEQCPRCGLPFERGEGYWLGAMAINLGITETVFGVVLVGVALATWPDVPWVGLTIGAVVLNTVVPVLFYPFSKTIFIAIDLVLLHPERRGSGGAPGS